jgi:hypothetical protein
MITTLAMSFVTPTLLVGHAAVQRGWMDGGFGHPRLVSHPSF